MGLNNITDDEIVVPECYEDNEGFHIRDKNYLQLTTLRKLCEKFLHLDDIGRFDLGDKPFKFLKPATTAMFRFLEEIDN